MNDKCQQGWNKCFAMCLPNTRSHRTHDNLSKLLHSLRGGTSRSLVSHGALWATCLWVDGKSNAMLELIFWEVWRILFYFILFIYFSCEKAGKGLFLVNCFLSKFSLPPFIGTSTWSLTWRKPFFWSRMGWPHGEAGSALTPSWASLT